MQKEKIRNIAIIAHVDHGKTTLVDQLFKQSGLFRDNQVIAERLMDSIDLERERGITIAAKNGSFKYRDYLINIIDTPGHADFGGQVERVLRMADGALLLVDAAEGPMPQTFFVLKKALQIPLPIIVVINKIDKPAARCDWTVEQVFDLFIKLNAPDHILDFPIIYASAKNGFARLEVGDTTDNLGPLYDTIIDKLPPPQGDEKGPFQLLVCSISYSPFLGRLAIGKITSGSIRTNQEVAIAKGSEVLYKTRVTKIYGFEGPSQVVIQEATVGMVVALAGSESINVGETFTDPVTPIPLPALIIDPPTVSMDFIANDSPFAGREGKYVTSRHLRERLYRETLSDVALVVEDKETTAGFKVSGRGELHLAILIEKMRRENYEFQVTRPQVIYRELNGKKQEPFEELSIDVDEAYMGAVIECVGGRRGQLIEMSQENGMARLTFRVPTRGLLGFRSEFMNLTRGMGIMNYIFLEYGDFAGPIKNLRNGVMISMEECTTVAFALWNLEERGRLFMGPGDKVYMGQIIGEHSHENDLVVNPGKGKKLTNVRASGSDEAVSLTPFTRMELEKCLAYINDDELVEVTPQSIRLRKILLDESDRKRARNVARKEFGA